MIYIMMLQDCDECSRNKNYLELLQNASNRIYCCVVYFVPDLIVQHSTVYISIVPQEYFFHKYFS